MAKKQEFRLKDGSVIVGSIIARAMHIIIVKSKSSFFLINRDKIRKDENEQLKLDL